jgi:hypothetical protein
MMVRRRSSRSTSFVLGQAAPEAGRLGLWALQVDISSAPAGSAGVEEGGVVLGNTALARG